MVSSWEQQAAEQGSGRDAGASRRWWGESVSDEASPDRPGTEYGRRGRGIGRRSRPTRPPRSPRPGHRAGRRPGRGAPRRGRGTGSGRRPCVAPVGAPRPAAGSKPSVACSTTRPSRQSVPAGPLGGVGPALVARRRRRGHRRRARRWPRPSRSRRARGWARRGLEAERRGRRRRASSGAGAGRRVPRVLGVDVEQADVAHALEVGPHGVDVQVEGVGDVRRRQRQRASGPARGRWRSGCCRRGPSARRGAASGRQARSRADRACSPGSRRSGRRSCAGPATPPSLHGPRRYRSSP